MVVSQARPMHAATSAQAEESGEQCVQALIQISNNTLLKYLLQNVHGIVFSAPIVSYVVK